MYSIVKNRVHAGQLLAKSKRLNDLSNEGPLFVLGLPRGGVPVAYEIAKKFNCPMDVLIVRKIGVPYQPEVAMGALSVGNIQFLNHEFIRRLGITKEQIDVVVQEEKAELERRNTTYRSGKEFPDLQGYIVLIVDDGIATGATIKAAIMAVKGMKPARIVVLAPVGSPDSVQEIGEMADEVIVPHQPDPFNAVGLWYESFPQTSDTEVISLLVKHEKEMNEFMMQQKEM